MEIKQGKGQFCQRDLNLKSTISKNENQAGHRPILSEGSQSKIYYCKKLKSSRALTDFVRGIEISNLLLKKMEIRRGKGQFCQRDPYLKSTTSKNLNLARHRLILSEGSKYQI